MLAIPPSPSRRELVKRMVRLSRQPSKAQTTSRPTKTQEQSGVQRAL